MDNAQKAIIIGVGLFITIIIISAVLIVVNIGQGLISDATDELGNIAGNLTGGNSNVDDENTPSGDTNVVIPNVNIIPVRPQPVIPGNPGNLGNLEPDLIGPKITIIAKNTEVEQKSEIIYEVFFEDESAIKTINLTKDSITLNGFTATKEISGTENVWIIKLTNVQGEPGNNKTITIASGVAKDSEGNLSAEVNSSGFKLKEALLTLGSLVASAADYGKTVNYKANGVSNWQVFYEKEGYVYLIASEMLTYEQIPKNLPNTTVTSTGTVYWKGEPSKSATIQNASRWMANWGTYTTGINAKCVSYLLDETYWTAFKNTSATYKDYVVGAIGTPTLEMFAESYMEKMAINNSESKITITTKTVGYLPTNSRILETDNLYFNNVSNDIYILLASPGSLSSSEHENLDKYIPCIGRQSLNVILCINYSSSGLRPVVCLRSDIPAKVGTTTDYEI